MSEFITNVIDWYMAHINYWTITFLMAIESSFLPLPSEIVVPPAAWKAAQGELNVFLVLISATIGALIGAIFNYYLALLLGRKLVYKFADTKLAHMFFIRPESVKKAEDYFIKNGNISTFIGRLIPGIRHLISLCAGFAKMDLKSFIIYTFTGAFIWNVTLAALGYFLYSQKEMLEKYYREITWAFIAAGVIFVLYLIYKGVSHKKSESKA